MGDARADVVDGVAGLTPAWLTEALAPVTGGAEVIDVAVAPIGTGQVADTVRLSPTYRPGGAGPATLVAKVPSSSETSRAAALATRTYEIEAGFYRDLAEGLPVRAPRCFHAAHDPATDAYVVLLEDVAPAEQGDQITGCTVDEAAAAIDELAHLHAPRWGDPTLAELAWLDRGTEENLRGMALLVQTLVPGFLGALRRAPPPGGQRRRRALRRAGRALPAGPRRPAHRGPRRLPGRQPALRRPPGGRRRLADRDPGPRHRRPRLPARRQPAHRRATGGGGRAGGPLPPAHGRRRGGPRPRRPAGPVRPARLQRPAHGHRRLHAGDPHRAGRRHVPGHGRPPRPPRAPTPTPARC